MVRHWKSQDEISAVKHLEQALQPHIKFLLGDKGEIDYPSDEMNVGVDVQKLVKFKDALVSLLLLDRRGGHFSNPDVAEAILALINEDAELKAFMNKNVLVNGTGNLMQSAQKNAYMLRVLLAHCRLKKSAYDEIQLKGGKIRNHPEELIEHIYPLIQPAEDDSQSLSAKSSSANSQNTFRKHPFLNFRPQAEETQEPDVEETARYWDPDAVDNGNQIGPRAVALMSDGTKVFSSKFTVEQLNSFVIQS